MYIRKRFCAAVSLLAVAHLHAQQQPSLLSDPPDGSETVAPEVRAAFKPAVVEETTVHREGGRNITVQRLALDPNDPVRPVVEPDPTPAPQPDGTAPGDFLTAPAHLLLLSATVSPGPATHLSWTYRFPDGTSRDFSGWSNIDFNHFTGISTFLATDGEEHSFVMGIGNVESPTGQVPAFPTQTPTFLPEQQEIPAEALVTVDSLHKLYAIEHAKLAAAHAGRQRAEAARTAELIANPPEPKDLIIRYRIVETPVATETSGQAPTAR